MDDVIYRAYRELAVSAILAGVNDYLSGFDTERYFETWVTQSDFFDYLKIDRIAFLGRVKYLKRKGIKYIGGVRNYAKKTED